jgi:hypothetical protein
MRFRKSLLYSLLLMISQWTLAQQPITLGDEFRVNAYSVGDQKAPATASNLDGRTVIAYQSAELDGDGDGIFLQLYDEHDNQVTGEIPVNTFNTGNQRDPAVAMDLEGNFVVVWASNGQDGDKWGVFGQLFASDGTKIGNEFPVNTYTTDTQQAPAVAMNAEGTFVVVWESDGQDGSGLGVYGQRFNASGNKLSGEFRVNTTTFVGQLAPAVSMNTNGHFVVVWTRGSLLSSGSDIYAQRFDAQGNFLGGEFLVNTYTDNVQSNPDIDANLAGDFVVVWESSSQDGSLYGVYGQQFKSDGTKTGSEFPVNSFTTNDQEHPAVAMDPSGSFTVTWESDGQDGSGEGIYGQRFTSGGNYLGSEFQVNTTTLNAQSEPVIATDASGDVVVAWPSDGQDGSLSGFQAQAQRYMMGDALTFQVNTFQSSSLFWPDIAMDSTGNYVVVWQSGGQDGFGTGVFGQRFAADGTALGGEFPVNTFTQFSQLSPSIAMDSDGDFVVVWASSSQDGYEYGIYGQRYDANGVPQGGEFRINTTTYLDQDNPSAGMDADGNFVVVWRSQEQDGSGDANIYGQRYAHDGTKIGGEFPVSTLSGYSDYPQVAMNAKGDFVVVWRVFFSTGVFDVYCQPFNAGGIPQGNAFQLEATTGGDELYSDIAIDSAGNFTAVWASEVEDDDFELWLESFTPDAEPINTPINVASGLENSGAPSIAINNQGNGVVTWRGLQEGAYRNFGRLFFADHNLSTSFELNPENIAFVSHSPVASIDPQGNMVFVWRNDENDGTRDGIFAQRFRNKFPPVCSPGQRTLSGTENTYATQITETELLSDQVIEENAIVRYQAGNSIHLQPGFHAVPGTYFRATIEGCEDPIATSAATGPNSFSERDRAASVHQLKTLRLSLAPNPVNRELNLRLESPESARAEIRIISLQGTIVFRKQIALTAGRNTHTVELAKLPAGMYVLQTHSGPHQEQVKFVKH